MAVIGCLGTLHMVVGNIFKAPPDKVRWELPIRLFPWSHTLETAKEAQG
jgi:hypothetical protein